MERVKKIYNKNVFLFTIVIWTILNICGIQNIYFSAAQDVKYAVLKVLHFVFLYFIFYKFYSLYKNRKEKSGKIEIISGLICFAILSICLFKAWPGTWSWDDIEIVRNCASFTFTPWQHFLSSVFQILCLQTIPIVAGVIAMQILIASLIVGYVISKVSIIYGKNLKSQIVIGIVLLLIALLQPIVMYILSGFRMGIYSFFELLIVVKLLVLYKENEKISILDILIIGFFTIIVASWRTEGFYYPFMVCLLFLLLGKNKISKKAIFASFVLMILGMLALGKYNNHLIGDNDYSVSATIGPASSLVKVADETDKVELEDIGKVIDINYVLENPEKRGEEYFWERRSTKRLL